MKKLFFPLLLLYSSSIFPVLYPHQAEKKQENKKDNEQQKQQEHEEDLLSSSIVTSSSAPQEKKNDSSEDEVFVAQTLARLVKEQEPESKDVGLKQEQYRYPVIFHEQNEIRGCDKTDEYLSIINNRCDKDLQRKIRRNEDAIITAYQAVRPEVIIKGVNRTVTNKQKYQGHVLESCTEQKVVFDESGAFKKIKAWLKDDTSLGVKLWRNGTKSLTAEEFTKDLKKKALCLVINKIAKTIYIGCQDGALLAFNVNNKSLDELWLAKHGPIGAVNVMHNGSCIVYKNDAGVHVWSIGDALPRVTLEAIGYSKDYVFDNKIVRSHSDRALVSYFDGDKVYDIPLSYLQKEGNINLNQAAVISLLYRIQKLSHQDSQLKDLIESVYHSAPLKTFEPSVQAAFKEFLEMKANENNIELSREQFKPLE